MAVTVFRYIIGQRLTDVPGQWVAGHVELRRSYTMVQADLCRSSGPDQFGLYRLRVRLDGAFSAQTFLALCSLLTHEFEPSCDALEITYPAGLAGNPEISQALHLRTHVKVTDVPSHVARYVRAELRKARLMFALQRHMMMR